jgi:hypothetical protein
MTTINDVFGPIGSEYCLYFYILSVIGMLFFVMVFVGILFTGITKKMGIEFYLISFLYSLLAEPSLVQHVRKQYLMARIILGSTFEAEPMYQRQGRREFVNYMCFL